VIRIGIVGAGFIGAVHSAALEQLCKHRLVEAQVTAIFDPDAGRAAELAAPHGATVCGSADDLLAQVDAVWICTWTAAHRSVVEAAANRGVAIFCEKPLAPTWADAVAVADAMATVSNQVGLVLRSSPVFVALAERLATASDGRHLATVFRDDQYFPIQGIYGSTWRGDARLAGGGTLIEHSIHDLDLLRWLHGDPVQVSASIATRPGHAGIDDIAICTLRYESGAAATLVSVWHDVMTRLSTRRLEVLCADAVLVTENDQVGPLEIETSSGCERRELDFPDWVARFDGPPAFQRSVAGYAVANRRFLDAVVAGRPGTPDAGVALAAHRLAEAAYRSAAAGGAPVPVDSLEVGAQGLSESTD